MIAATQRGRLVRPNRGAPRRVLAWFSVWFAALLAAAALAAPARAADLPLSWNDLRPVAVAEDDPFARLPADQLDLLRQLVLARLIEQRIGSSDVSRAQAKALLAQLAAQGLDGEALLARRLEIIEQRRGDAEQVSARVEGQRARLGGYVVPLAVEGDHVREFLLVPWAGACSHVPPPPPNQIVRVRGSAPLAAAAAQRSVLVAGTLRLRAQVQSVLMIDGAMVVQSGYAIDDAEITLAAGATDAAPPAARVMAER